MQVILISGKARAGKDLSANILKEEFVKEGKTSIILHYADFLKSFCREHLSYKGKDVEGGRELLQWFGTDVVRNNYEDTWVDMMFALLKGIRSEYDCVIIPDVRFPNEIEKIKNNFKSVTLRIVRNNEKNELSNDEKKHLSETALDDYEFEHVIFNNGTIDELKNSLSYFKSFCKEK